MKVIKSSGSQQQQQIADVGQPGQAGQAQKLPSLGGDAGGLVGQLADRSQTAKFEESGAGLLGNISEMVKGWVGAGVRAGTNPSEVLKNKIDLLRDQRPKLDQKVALLGARLSMAKDAVQKDQAEYARLTKMTEAALAGGNEPAAKKYLLDRESVKARITTGEQRIVVAEAQYEQGKELRSVTLDQIKGQIEEAHAALDRAEAAKVDKEVANALTEVSRAVDGGVGDLVNSINAGSAKSEALLNLHMEESGALQDARILRTAAAAKGDDLLAAFKKDQA